MVGRDIFAPDARDYLVFGMMNRMYMWFKDGGRISRDDYAEVATTPILEGIKSVR